MRKSSSIWFIFALILSLINIVSASTVSAQEGNGEVSRAIQIPEYVPDEILVKFKEGFSPFDMLSVHSWVGGDVLKSFEIVENLDLVRLSRGMDMNHTINLYRQHPYVLYAEPNYIVKALTFPNDPRFNELWGLYNTGQGGGTPDADIEAPDAWDVTIGSSSVVVAVIDTGIDYNHEDLSSNMFRNTADCNSNGVDDDGNGYIDDCYGIDTYNNDSDPMDDHNHGTHVAGTIGAIGNNSIGVVGVNWNVNFMACKFLSAGGSGSTSGAISCLNYVKTMKDRGVNIIATSNSWGGGGFSQSLFDAIDAHRQRGILFIAAAGNDTTNNDNTPHYPSNYYLPNIISVAATTRTDGLASFSNYGKRTVHLGAPGHQILSTTIGNAYSTFSGTSMATPHVTGVAALLKAQDPNRDWRAIKNLILAGGENISSLTNTITQKRLNAYGALSCSNSIVLSRLRPISNSITGLIGTSIDLPALHVISYSVWNINKYNKEETYSSFPEGINHKNRRTMSKAIEKNIEKRLIELKYDTSFGFEILEDRRAIFNNSRSIIDNEVLFYSVLVYSTLPYKRLTVALNRGLNVFIMPEEIDMILSEGFKKNINKENLINLANLYVALSTVPPHYIHLIHSYADISDSKRKGISPLEYKDIIYEPEIEESKDHYIVKFFVWGNVGGRLEKWNLLITKNGKVKIEKKRVGQGIGDFEIVQ